MKAHARSLIVWISIGLCVLELLALMQFYWERDIRLPYGWKKLTYLTSSTGNIFSDSESAKRFTAIRASALSALTSILQDENVAAVGEASSSSIFTGSGFSFLVIHDPDDSFTHILVNGRSLTDPANQPDTVPVWAIKDTIYADAYYQGQREISFLGMPCEIIGVYDYFSSPLLLSPTDTIPSLIAEFGQLLMDRLSLSVESVDPALQTKLVQLLPELSALSNNRLSMKVQSGTPLADILHVMLADKFTIMILAVILILLVSAAIIINLEIFLLEPVYDIHDLCGAGTRGLLKQELRLLLLGLQASGLTTLLVFYLINKAAYSGEIPIPHFTIILAAIAVLAVLYLLIFSLSLIFQRQRKQRKKWKQVAA